MKLLLSAAIFLFAASIALAVPPPHGAFITMSGPGITIGALDDVIAVAAQGGGHIRHVFPVHSQPGRVLSGFCLIGTILPGKEAEITSRPFVTYLYREAVDLAVIEPAGEEAVSGARFWNFLLAGGGDEPPPPGVEPLMNDALGPLVNGEPLGGGKAKSSPPRVTLAQPGQVQTSEFMIGRVAVGLVLPESNGSGENWSNVDNNAQPATNPPTVITDRPQEVYNRVWSALDWWDRQGGNGANLTFVYDRRNGIATTQEPITVNANPGQEAWISDVLNTMGFNGTPATYLQQVYAYNNSIRTASNCDWAFSIFVADSFNDADGMFPNTFPNGWSAFAWMYGPYMVMTYDNGTSGVGGAWGILRMHLVASHETGHIFGAPDEYQAPTCTCTNYGYLGVTNGNCVNCVGTQVVCVMASNTQQLCNFTRGHVGWRDTDSDGILDPVDCALSFPSASLSYYVSPYWGKSQIRGQGVVRATPWTSPTRTSVTINQVRASYSVDSGGATLATPTDGAFNSDDEAFTFTTSSYSDGQHNVGLTAQDNYGNTATLGTPLQVTIDTSPPPSAPASAVLVEAPYSASSSVCNVNWTLAPTSDPQSGLYGHRVALYRPTVVAPVTWADVQMPAQSRALTGLSLQHGWSYRAFVYAINQAGLRGPGAVTSNMTVDLTPPSAPASMSDGGAGTSQLDRLSFSWAASTEDVSGILDYRLSIRDNLNNWIVSSQSTGNVTTYTATGLSLTLGRKYFGNVVPVNGAGTTGTASPESDGIMAATAYSSISNAKLNASLGSAAFIPGVYVFCSGADQPGIVYVLQSSGTCGIRTDNTSSIARPYGVDVAGILQLNPQNELYLQNSEVYALPSVPWYAMVAFAMPGRTVGGSAFGLQPAFVAGSGLNTAALPVRTWGRVTYVSTGPPYYFVIDDGSGWTDPAGWQGIGVRCGSITPPSQGSFVTVTGICSYESGYPVILLRQPGDWW